MINHLTNDIIVMGATPLTVQDAIICGGIDKETVSSLVKYVSEACKANGSVLTGGETSEQPNVVPKGTYILTASIVGVVEKDGVIDGSNIAEGDKVIALPSNGLHTNGYSFIRKMMEENPEIIHDMVGDESFLDAILKPHRAYYADLTPLFSKPNLVGMAHITGGGIAGNLNRILPKGLSANVDCGKIETLPIFKKIRQETPAGDSELLKTFNMGVGMVLVVKNGSENEFNTYFKDERNLKSYTIGEIVKGNQTVNFSGKLIF
jgi:phosphoribosylformylglycinamidine cyclo-ligase